MVARSNFMRDWASLRCVNSIDYCRNHCQSPNLARVKGLVRSPKAHQPCLRLQARRSAARMAPICGKMRRESGREVVRDQPTRLARLDLGGGIEGGGERGGEEEERRRGGVEERLSLSHI